MSHRFTPEAMDDLRDAARYYEAERDGLGLELVIEVGIGLATIENAPRRWPEIEPGARKYRIDRFPFAILYRVNSPHHFEVVAIFDLRRRPGSWKTGGS